MASEGKDELPASRVEVVKRRRHTHSRAGWGKGKGGAGWAGRAESGAGRGGGVLEGWEVPPIPRHNPTATSPTQSRGESRKRTCSRLEV